MNKNDKKSYIKYVLFAALLVISIVSGILFKNSSYKMEYIDLYKIDGNKITSSISSFNKKQINNANKQFNKDNKDVSIYPISAQNHFYVMKIKNDTKDKNKTIKNKYTSFIKEKIKDISIVDYSSKSEMAASNTIVSVISRMVAVTFVFLAYLYLLKQMPQKYDFKINDILLFIVSAVSTVTGYTITLAILLLFAAIYFKLRYKEENKFLSYIFLVAIIVRLLAIVGMFVVNVFRTGSILSYFQPDEMFYYYTGGEIYLSLSAGKWPALLQITGVKQYGYNLLLGFIELLNRDVLLTSKLLNALISSVFVIMSYRFVVNFFKNTKAAKITSIFMTIIPSYALFSAFLLRDIIIAVLIFAILDEVMKINEHKEKTSYALFKIIVFSIVLWFFRNYTLIIILALAMLYTLLRIFEKKKKPVLIILIVAAVLVIPLGEVVSKIYGFNILNSFISYFKSLGILKYLTGIVCSTVNLDFITNASTTTYSIKTIILRMFYPDTIFLIITAPLYILGIVKLYKKNKSFTIVNVVMTIGFITLYKFQYGGWFLRTQLQIFVFQYIFIALGFAEMWKDKKFTGKLKFLNLLS
ncbi:MAG: hypothetical protein SPJ62_06105 [Inconstantimicrobium porci]|uniref:hypothetical protein n=1 Tax=Inconstantimicrobium porci TaxID=2652291 RepID=UPI002A90B9ED|nr:hypothetical protein [Inconstantimicrobium porci]MDY5911573.1 hypothetical protein [Inconstantimicrobium porci]